MEIIIHDNKLGVDFYLQSKTVPELGKEDFFKNCIFNLYTEPDLRLCFQIFMFVIYRIL